ncbi:MAG: SPOR domain-containing protein [Clostridia bacterium]|nr:SPOR domain-containing protein [Clostridia bacterium]
MAIFGIDVSRYQGDFDFARAAGEGVRFAVLKGGGGNAGYYVDSAFVRNYGRAKALGLPVGVYWYSRALSAASAKAEADWCYENILTGRQFELPVYIDVEESAMLSLGRRALTDVIRTWCDTLEKRGYFVGIYSSYSFFRDCMYDEELQDYTHWVAQWSSRCDYTKATLGMWQFGGETNVLRPNTVAGVVCDQDYMYVDFPAIIKGAGLNGFGTVNEDKTLYRVQIGAFYSKANAEAYAESARAKGFPAIVVPSEE